MAGSDEQRATSPRRALIAVAVAGFVAAAALLALRPADDRVALRSGEPAGEVTDPATDPSATRERSTATTSTTVTTSTPSTTAPSPTTAPAPTTTVTPAASASTDAPAAPATDSSVAAAASAPPPSTTTAVAPTTGTLRLELAPAEEGTKRVWVSGPDGRTVLPPTEVEGPIVIDGLAPGTYDVFIEETGEPSGPDENGVELGGGSSIARQPVDVAAGETTTVP